MIRIEQVCEGADLANLLAPWDELAVAGGRPYCAPGWMLSWWSEAAPPRARLVVLAAYEAHTLVGVVPLWSERTRLGVEQLRLLAGPICAPVCPLARPGAAGDVVAAVAQWLARTHRRPRMFTLDRCEESSPWSYSSCPQLHLGHDIHASAIDLPARTGSGAEEDERWLRTTSANFRQQVRRGRRRLVADGIELRRVGDTEALTPALRDFWRLHYQRMGSVGGSDLEGTRAEAVLAKAARDLAPRSRLWLWIAATREGAIGAHLFVSAGDTVAYWNGGFDERFAAYRPGFQLLAAAVDDALRRGYRVFELGPGAQHYKRRFATREYKLQSGTLIAPNRGYALARGQLVLNRLRRTAISRLSPEQRQRVRQLLSRVS